MRSKFGDGPAERRWMAGWMDGIPGYQVSHQRAQYWHPFSFALLSPSRLLAFSPHLLILCNVAGINSGRLDHTTLVGRTGAVVYVLYTKQCSGSG